MKIIGFGFTKQFAEKLSDPHDQFSVNTGINIKDIQLAKADFLKGEDALSMNFEFKINYEKDLARIAFNGNVVLALDKKIATDILKKWKDKKVPDMIRIPVFNYIMSKCTVKALQFEEDFNLPRHIQIPQFKGIPEESQPEAKSKK